MIHVLVTSELPWQHNAVVFLGTRAKKGGGVAWAYVRLFSLSFLYLTWSTLGNFTVILKRLDNIFKKTWRSRDWSSIYISFKFVSICQEKSVNLKLMSALNTSGWKLWWMTWSYRVFQKFVPIFSSLKFHWLLKITSVNPSMLFIIHLTLINWNISIQNVFLYDFWHFLSG